MMLGGWLQQRLINPIAFHLSSILKQNSSAHSAFSVASVLEAPRQVLIIPDDRPGGLFLGASQFWAIRNRYPESRICLLTHASRAYIARELPFVDGVIVYSDFFLPFGGKLREAVKELREQTFDIAFCFSDEASFCPAYLCYKSEARIRIGFQRQDFPFFNIRIVPHGETRYIPNRFALILRTLGIPPVNEQASWSVSEQGARRVQSRFLVGREADEQFVGLDISHTSGDRPSGKQFQTISEQIVARPGVRVLVFFDFSQRKTANQIKETLGQKALLFQTDNLPKIVALLRACTRIITCNTDLFHLAAAMGLPITGIFDPRDIEPWVPPSRENIEIVVSQTVQNWTPQQIDEALARVPNTLPEQTQPAR